MNNRERGMNRRVGLIVLLCALIGCMVFTLFLTCVMAEEDTDTQRYKYYKTIEIEDGDTLWDIAQEYCTDEYASTDAYITELMDMNGLATPDRIYAGDQLTIAYYSSELR